MAWNFAGMVPPIPPGGAQYIDPNTLRPQLPGTGIPGYSYAGGSPTFDESGANPQGNAGFMGGPTAGSGTGLMAGATSGGAVPVAPNYQGWVGHGPLANLLQPAITNDLNSRVASGAITQDQANSQWQGMLAEGARRREAQDTSFRQFQQHGLTSIGAAALGAGPAGFLPIAGAAANDPGAHSYGGAMPMYRPGGGGTAEQAQQGGLFDNLLGTVGNLSPALLAGYLGNSQRQDVMGQVGKINDVASGLSGPAFMQSITNPYDLQTGQGRTALSQSLQQRGVGGSSFGNQQLGNFDYQRGLGRGDLATRAAAGVAGTQGQLYSNALHGIVGGNAAYNSLLGAGLGASGSLFNRPGQTGLGGSLSGIGSQIGRLFGGGIPTLPGAPPNFSGPGVDQFGNPTGASLYSGGDPSQYGDQGGNWDPNTGMPSTSGNGLFDWLGQNGGGDLGLNF